MNLPAWVPPLMFAAGSVIALGVMARNLRRARLIEDTPTSRIRSAAQGYVELQGLARAGAEPLLAPLTNTPCLWYRYRIERESNGDKQHRWQTVESGTSSQPFWLDDNSGRCSVEPKQAEVTPTRRQQWSGDRRHPLKVTPDGLPGLLNTVLNGGGDDYRYIEERIQDGDFLYLTGWFESSNPPSADTQAAALSTKLLRDWKQDQTQLLARFDHNRDGQIDTAEWEQARGVASREAQQQVLRDFDHSQRHTLRAPSSGQPFLISSHDPEQLAGRYRRQALFGLLIAGLLAAVAGLLIART